MRGWWKKNEYDEAGADRQHAPSMVAAMRLRHPKTFVTGRPGIGKTTLVRKTLACLAPVEAAGFISRDGLLRKILRPSE